MSESYINGSSAQESLNVWDQDKLGETTNHHQWTGQRETSHNSTANIAFTNTKIDYAKDVPSAFRGGKPTGLGEYTVPVTSFKYSTNEAKPTLENSTDPGATGLQVAHSQEQLQLAETLRAGKEPNQNGNIMLSKNETDPQAQGLGFGRSHREHFKYLSYLTSGKKEAQGVDPEKAQTSVKKYFSKTGQGFPPSTQVARSLGYGTGHRYYNNYNNVRRPEDCPEAPNCKLMPL